MELNKLTPKNKCIFAIKLAERASLYLQKDNYKNLIDKAIKICWEWIYIEKYVGETLYFLLDNEEEGFTLFQEMEEDEKKICAWNCIIDAIAYVSRASYEKEGIKYFPEPIEIVDDNTLKHMMQSLLVCYSNEKKYIGGTDIDLLMKEIFGMRLDRTNYFALIDKILNLFYDTFGVDMILVDKEEVLEHMGYFMIRYRYLPLAYEIIFENERNVFSIYIYDSEGARNNLYRIEKFESETEISNIENAIKILDNILNNNDFCFYLNRDGKLYKKKESTIQKS